MKKLLLLIALAIACSPTPQWTAVVGESGTQIYIYDYSLNPVDTLELQAGIPPLEKADFQADGASLLAVTQHELLRIRRTDGALIDRTEFPLLLDDAIPLGDSRTILLTGTEESQGQSVGVVKLLSHLPLRERKSLTVCTRPVKAMLGRSTRRVFVICDSDTVMDVDADLGIITNSIRLSDDPADSTGAPVCGATDGALSPNETLVYVLCGGSAELLYLDRVTLGALAQVAVPDGSAALSLTPDGRLAVITGPGNAGLDILDLAQRSVSAHIDIGGPPIDLAFGTRNDRLYAVTGGSGGTGRLLSIDLVRGLVNDSVKTATVPRSVSVWPGAWIPLIAWTGSELDKP